MQHLAGGAMILRPASSDDVMDVWEWRNDPLTRAMSRSRNEIDRATHREWFTRALGDPSRKLLIGEADGEKVGMVRFDFADETEVSINVNPAHRSRGYGRLLLSQALALVSGDVVAEVGEDNLASQRLFERAGFQ